MDSNDTKQIIIGYNSIKDSCKAMLKPIRTNLNDTETAMKMSTVEAVTLEYIKTACKGIQKVLDEMEDYVGDLEESVYNDGEIKDAGKMISDILFDVPPVSKKILNPHSMSNIAKAAGL